MVWYILESIVINKMCEYSITCVEDLVKIFERYYHPIQYRMSLYGQYGHKFGSLEEFYSSLDTSSESYEDKMNKRYIKEVFKSFELTPEWLNYIEDVNDKKYKKLRMRAY